MRNTANQASQSDEDRNIVGLISCSSNVSGRYYLLKSKKKCIKVYKITTIVCVRWLAEMCDCMRVCKHGCGVKMFCTSCANHASTNLKKFLSWKLNKFTLCTYSLVWWNLQNRDNRWFSDKMGRCMYERGFRNTIGTYDFHKLKLPPFLNTPTRPGIIRSGKRLRLLTETLTSTLVVKKAIHRSLHPNNSQQEQWNWDSWSVDAYDQTT